MPEPKSKFVDQADQLPGKEPTYVYARPDYTPDAYDLINNRAKFGHIEPKWEQIGKGVNRRIILSLPPDISGEEKKEMVQRMVAVANIAQGILRGERLEQTNQHGRSWRTSIENGIRLIERKQRDMDGRHARILVQGEKIVIETTQRELHRAQQESPPPSKAPASVSGIHYLPFESEMDAYSIILDCADFDGKQPRWKASRGGTKQSIILSADKDKPEAVYKMALAANLALKMLQQPQIIDHTADREPHSANPIREYAVSVPRALTKALVISKDYSAHSAVTSYAHGADGELRNVTPEHDAGAFYQNQEQLQQGHALVLESSSRAINRAAARIKQLLKHERAEAIQARQQGQTLSFKLNTPPVISNDTDKSTDRALTDKAIDRMNHMLNSIEQQRKERENALC